MSNVGPYREMVERYLADTGQTPQPCGAIGGEGERRETTAKRSELVTPLFVPPGTWLIACRLESEANVGGKLQAAIRRKFGVKTAVWRAMGPHWQAWGPIGDAIRADEPAKITVTRIGGRELDTANLWRAVKPVEDAIAVLLGCDDGWPAWKRAFRCECQPGPAWGIRVTMEV